MNTFLLIISSPDGDIFRGECCKFDVRSTEGELGIMAGHIPFACAVVPCECKILLPNDEEKTAKTQGGLLTVDKNSVTFISGTFEFIN